MSNITFQVESFEDTVEEMKPLFDLHWEEIAIHRDKIKLNPDYEQYALLCEAGALHIVTARDGGKMIGYFISFLQPHLHYLDHTFAINDVLFLLPEYRHTDIGAGMFMYAEEKLKEAGASVIIIHMKTHAPFDSLCLALGYENVERNYSKYVGDE